MVGETTARARQRGFLSRELIIQEAMALLDEHGPGALSMRRLADRLGVVPNALYTHVRGKADLVEGLIDQVYAGLELDPDPNDDWAGQLAALSQAIRAQLLAHPAVIPLALQQPGLGPNGLRLGEAIYAVLRPAGFSDQAVVGAVYALLTYILGFVALEVPRAGTDPQTSDEFVRRLHAFFAALPAGEFPHTVDLAALLARISTDDQFQFGIRTFLAGLDAGGSMVERPLATVTDRGSLKSSLPATRLNTRWEAPEKALCPEVYSPKGGLTMLASW